MISLFYLFLYFSLCKSKNYLETWTYLYKKKSRPVYLRQVLFHYCQEKPLLQALRPTYLTIYYFRITREFVSTLQRNINSSSLIWLSNLFS